MAKFYSLPLQQFFETLRKNNFDLGLGEYYSLIEALNAGFRYDENKSAIDKNNLKFLCKTLWLKPNQSPYEFERLLEETFEAIELPSEAPTENDNKTEQKQELSDSSSDETNNSNKEKRLEKGKDNDIEGERENEEINTNESHNNSGANEEFRIKFELTEGNDEKETGMIPQDAQVTRSFLFSKNYFNITQRELKQAARFLPVFTPSAISQEIDYEATAQHWAKKGYFEKPIYKQQKYLYNRLVLLIDNKGSMQAFEKLGDMLSLALKEAFDLKQNEPIPNFEEYFFYNVPQGFFYKDKVHVRHESVGKLFAAMQKQKALCIIFSDAGAARGGNSDGRFKATLRFVIQARKAAKHLV